MTAVPDMASAARLSAREKATLGAEVITSYVHGRWRLKRSGLRDAVAAQRSVAAQRTNIEDAVASGRRLGRVVRRTLSVVPADTRCLAQSLTLTRMLARRGIDSRLVIGVRPGERFAAHAWVEHEGVPLLPPGGQYEELLTL